MPRTIAAEFSLNTPLFSSGASPASPELRVSEMKAALRFWWRAMNYQLATTAGGGCSALAARESQLFGSTNGQSPFLLRLSENTIDVTESASADKLVAAAATKYLGYGLTETGADRSGWRADADKTFTIELTLKARALADQQEYIDALHLFGLFGGLGYRSRRGFGSITLQRLCIDGAAQRIKPASEGYAALPKTLLRGCPPATSEPEYSAFVSDKRFCRIVVFGKPIQEFGSGVAALDAVAKKFKELLTARPEGGGRRLQNGVALPSSDDISWAYLGLPRKYATGSPEHKPKALPDTRDPVNLERRASPLLVHVYRDTGTKKYGVVAVLFKSKFLPDGYGVATGSGTAQPLPTPAAEGYAWLDVWLNGIGTNIYP